MFNKKEKFTVGSYRWYYGWNLFWWKIEGFENLNGLNVYHPNDESSVGFILQGFGHSIRLRWSKRTKRLHWGIK